MFCEKCGTKLPEFAKFCPKCGTKICNFNLNDNQINKNSNEILLEVIPASKFIDIVLPKIWSYLVYIAFLILVSILIINVIKQKSEATTTEIIETLYMILKPVVLVFVGVPLIKVFLVMSKFFFDKKQYENYVYIFYKDRVIFKSNFFTASEKELKYKNIKEIGKKQKYIEKKLNIGSIYLYSNAESGQSNGMTMINIKNIDEIYKKVKEIVNI